MKYSFSSDKTKGRQGVVLPIHQLESNLVLLPGIVYSVTFSREKATALLSRFRNKAKDIPLIETLLDDFSNDDKSEEGKGEKIISDVISRRAEQGIKQICETESKIKGRKEDGTPSDFDWLVLAVKPNSGRIVNPSGEVVKSNNVVTIARVVSVLDDSVNIRLTLQALTRGQIEDTQIALAQEEAFISVDWKRDGGANGGLEALTASMGELFQCIESFINDYKHSLEIINKLEKASQKDQGKGDLLTLNPLANALFLRLTGSKDFGKAYASLKKLFKISQSNGSLNNYSLMRLIDLVGAVIPFPNYEKLELLTKIDVRDRKEKITQMVQDMIRLFDGLKHNNNFVSNWYYEEATSLQKAAVVANELKSIKALLEEISKSKRSKGDDNFKKARAGNKKVGFKTDGFNKSEEQDEQEDELAKLSDFIKNKMPTLHSMSDDTKRLLLKDYKRIKSSPSGNSDYHVISNYLEIVADIPWDQYVTKFHMNKDIDIPSASKQLDDDHYGLEHVKRRLIQYLVVLKLLSMNAEKDYERRKADSSSKKRPEGKKNLVTPKGNEPITLDNESSLSGDATNTKDNAKGNTTGEDNRLPSKSVIMSKNNKSPIIMLAGPPGTGKTSLAQSIAKALGRRFQRISLGGVKDESEIRGHRRTYVGAMPGVIIQSLRKARSMNPVILIDEIDKIAGGNNTVNRYNGDPAAALLEVLDPEQNNTFNDHYLGFPVDLSQVIFICTANEPYNLSRPLLDRLEMIEIGPYDYEQKAVIGERYLLPRQISRNGLPQKDLIEIDDSVMKKVIIDYTREAGVRNLERNLGTICRYKAVEYSQHLDSGKKYEASIREEDLAKYLGVPLPSLSSELFDPSAEGPKFGIVNGLSYNSDGSGSVLVFESIGFPSEDRSKSSTLYMTGRLGDILMESAKIGLAFVKLILYRNMLNLIDANISGNILEKFNNLEIHLHVPLGSIQKDGPSAGVTMALLFLSLVLEKPVPSDLAMTGEITLRGLVLPIGGVKEKVFGASLNGIKKVIIPRDNRRDVIEEYCRSINYYEEMNALLIDDKSRYDYKRTEPESYYLKKYGIEICYAKEFWDVIRIAWGENIVKLDNMRMIEYHI